VAILGSIFGEFIPNNSVLEHWTHVCSRDFLSPPLINLLFPNDRLIVISDDSLIERSKTYTIPRTRPPLTNRPPNKKAKLIWIFSMNVCVGTFLWHCHMWHRHPIRSVGDDSLSLPTVTGELNQLGTWLV